MSRSVTSVEASESNSGGTGLEQSPFGCGDGRGDSELTPGGVGDGRVSHNPIRSHTDSIGREHLLVCARVYIAEARRHGGVRALTLLRWAGNARRHAMRAKAAA